MGLSKGIGWVLLAACLAGCADHSAEEHARLAQIEADGRALNEAADQIETRLLADQSSVVLWQELAERHKHVSAIATENANAHIEGIERFISRQDQKMASMKHRRIASADELFSPGGDRPELASGRRMAKRRN
jgi:hypothetical protein